MQLQDEHTSERTYAAQAAEQDFSIDASPAARPQYTRSQADTADRSSQIYSYVTLVAERFQEARKQHISEVNNPATENAS